MAPCCDNFTPSFANSSSSTAVAYSRSHIFKYYRNPGSFLIVEVGAVACMHWSTSTSNQQMNLKIWELRPHYTQRTLILSRRRDVRCPSELYYQVFFAPWLGDHRDISICPLCLIARSSYPHPKKHQTSQTVDTYIKIRKKPTRSSLQGLIASPEYIRIPQSFWIEPWRGSFCICRLGLLYLSP